MSGNNPQTTRSNRSDTDLPLKGKTITFTLSSNTDPDELKKLLENISVIGRDGKPRSYKRLAKFSPKANSPKAGLHASLMKLYGRSGHLVRTLKGKRGYAVVREERNNAGSVTGNSATLLHTTLFEVTLDQSDSLVPTWEEIENNALPDSLKNTIQAEFVRQLKVCSHNALARSVVRMIDSLHGISLRPTGGVYWLPEQAIDVWNQVADAIEISGPGNNIYGFRTAFDEESAATILDALTRNVMEEVERMAEEVADADLDLGKRAMTTKLARAKMLKNRVAHYGKMLGTVAAEASKKMDKELAELTEEIESIVSLGRLNVLGSE
jgi:hypothetical protein